MEQLLRDVRIASIYEGTNGIQAMDLLGRKLGMKKGTVFMSLIQEMQKTAAAAREIQGLDELSQAFDKAVNRLGETAMAIGSKAMSPAFKTAFAHAVPFQEACGDVVMAWMLLWRASVAAPSWPNWWAMPSATTWPRRSPRTRTPPFTRADRIGPLFHRNPSARGPGQNGCGGGRRRAAADVPEACFGS